MPPRTPALPSPSRAYICPNCQTQSRLRTPWSRRSRTLRSFSSSTPRSTKYAILTNRRLLRLSGPDATNFLHDLLPAKILGVGTSAIYTAFLTAHGRILNDAFIYPPSWTSSRAEKGRETESKEAEAQRSREFEWWIEVDEVGLDILVKHFRKHKLRAKFGMEKVDPESIRVVYQWPSQSSKDTSDEVTTTQQNYRAGGLDPRPGMGSRFLVPTTHLPQPPSAQSQSPNQEMSVKDYTIHRILNGLAEGHTEIISGSALPQESNIDIIGGIDFHKGCYLGQELTIRTHHTGVVRKRILPCQIYNSSSSIPPEQEDPVYNEGVGLDLPPPESNMSKASSRRKGRSTGKWLGGVGNIGLALCRLEMMTDIQLTADTTGYDPEEEYKVQWGGGEEGEEVKEVKIKPFVPAWVREGIEASLNRKEKKPVIRREEEDEDEDAVD